MDVALRRPVMTLHGRTRVICVSAIPPAAAAAAVGFTGVVVM